MTAFPLTSCAHVRGGCAFGVVTFLFTDIEGSTRRWEADADAMRKALAAHDELLRKAIEAHEGLPLQAHRRRGVRSLRLAEVRSRCRGAAQRALEVAGSGARRNRAGGYLVIRRKTCLVNP